MISAQNVCKNYGPRRVLHDLNFEVRKGEIVGLLGPNGAGKTTLMRILTGFFPPTEGKVLLDGIELAKDPKKLKRQIGYLPERISLYPDLRVDEFLNFVAEIKGVPRKKRKQEIGQKMELCGVETVRNRLIGHLSKGFIQRLGLAQALLADPEVLILDEPTSGLDPKQIIEIRELIRQLGRERTLILSTHILPEVSKVCERVLILNQGRIVAQGTPEELERGVAERQEILVRVGQYVGAGFPRPSRGKGAVAAPLPEEIFRSISGIQSVERQIETDGSVTYLLQTLPHDDLRSEISKRIVEEGFDLLELSTKRLSLEDVFLKLVVSEQAVEL